MCDVSGFRVNPREGHLARARRIVGFLVKFKHASLRYRTGCPDCTDLAPQTCDWDSTPCGSVREEVPAGAPDPLGLPVITTAWVDANLFAFHFRTVFSKQFSVQRESGC